MYIHSLFLSSASDASLVRGTDKTLRNWHQPITTLFLGCLARVEIRAAEAIKFLE